MRYTININQYGICAVLKSDIDFTDAAVLDFAYWLCASVSPKIKKARIVKNNIEFTWFDYTHFLNENPLLHTKTKSWITKRLQRLEDRGFIVTYLSKGYFNRKYVAVLPQTEMLYTHTPIREIGEPDTTCEWCQKDDLPLNKHHYPILKSDGGIETVNICIACHQTAHLTDNANAPVLKKKHAKINKEQVPVLTRESIVLTREQNNNINNNNTKKNQNSRAKTLVTKTEEKFDFNEYIKSMSTDKSRHIQLIGKYFNRKNIKYDSKEKVQMAMKRHLRAARDLSVFSNKEIRQAVEICEEKYPNIDWTLETIFKILTSNNLQEKNDFEKKYKKIKLT